jgi:hypothetical protein
LTYSPDVAKKDGHRLGFHRRTPKPSGAFDIGEDMTGFITEP